MGNRRLPQAFVHYQPVYCSLSGHYYEKAASFRHSRYTAKPRGPRPTHTYLVEKNTSGKPVEQASYQAGGQSAHVCRYLHYQGYG